MNMKKIFASLTALCIIVISFCFGMTSYALTQTEDIEKTQIQSSDVYYSFAADTKTLTLSGSGAVPDFTNSSGASTSQPWFSWRSDGSVLHIVVEEGITSLGSYCFYSCTKADISLPSTLESLGSYSMARTISNTNVVLPENLTTISNGAFYYNTGLLSVFIPSSVTTIGSSAFENCTSLESVEFESMSMQVSIGKKAFLKCAALNSMTVPKNASISSYAIGYEKASSGYVYSDFTMNVYRDSDAYTYAVDNVVSYNLIDSYEISQCETVSRTYYSDSLTSVMTFVFTPEVSASYIFYSQGSVDVLCEATDSSGSVLGSSDDNSLFDSNFTVTLTLEANQTYYFNVSTNNSEGDFTVTLIPDTIVSISIDSGDISIPAAQRRNYIFDVEQYIEGKTVTVTYDTGYVFEAEYTSGFCSFDKEITYSDNQSESYWKCGSHSFTLTAGDASVTVPVTITHSYTATVTEPTYKTIGYTVYTCSLCGDKYTADYVKRTGVKVEGTVVLMQSPDGSHEDNIPVSDVSISVNGEEVCIAEDSGYFLFYTDEENTQITISQEFGITRTVTLNPDELNTAELGYVAFFHFDYNKDGYVGAKDFALLKKMYGKYPNIEKDDYISLDYNNDGVIDDDDWFGTGVESFYCTGKIDESIYDSIS